MAKAKAPILGEQCQECAQRLTTEQKLIAVSRGQVPLYCCKTCRDRARSRRARARKAQKAAVK